MYNNANMGNFEKLLEIAKESSKNAYAPYSKFAVGAALEYEDGTVYKGANVENASYGLAICAERAAIASAIANAQQGRIKAIAVYSPNTKMCTPCGACRQWLWEFEHGQDIKVILEEKEKNGGGIHITSITALLPDGFKL